MDEDIVNAIDGMAIDREMSEESIETLQELIQEKMEDSK